MSCTKVLLILMFSIFNPIYSMNNGVQQSLAQKLIKYCEIVIQQNKEFKEKSIAKIDLRNSPPTFDINAYHENKINKFEYAKNNIIDALTNPQVSLIECIKSVITINCGNMVIMLEIQDIHLTPTEKQFIKTLKTIL